MKGEIRRQEILRLVKGQGGLSVGDIAGRFGVSKMTAHRDLQRLLAEGRISRMYGGGISSPAKGLAGPVAQSCNSCDRPILNHQYRLQVKGGSDQLFCCAGCGLRAQLQNDSKGPAWATDFISGQEVPALDAYFLMASQALPCCQPSVLAFALEEEIIAFRSGFGGVPGQFTEALEYLRIERELNAETSE